MIDKKEFGKTVREYRTLRGMSVAELSGLINVTQRYIYQIESGQRVPGTDTAIKLMIALGMDISCVPVSSGIGKEAFGKHDVR